MRVRYEPEAQPGRENEDNNIKMSKIGKREITVLLKDLAASRPNEVNPVKDGGCVYEKKGSKGIRHCIAGQIVRDLGYNGSLNFTNTIDGVQNRDWSLLENVGAQEKFQVWLNKTFTPAALGVLNDAQTVADGRRDDCLPYELRGKTSVPWRAILHALPLTAADRNEVKDLL